MQNETDIAAATMIHIGKDPIPSLSATKDTAALVFKRRYPNIRDALLRSYRWNFSRRFVSLAGQSMPVPAFGFSYECVLPSGPAEDTLAYCLRVWRVKTDEAWTVQDRKLLLVSQPPLEVSYAARVEDVAAFDPLFSEVLAIDCALALGNRLGTSETRKRRNDLKDTRKTLIREARLSDALESVKTNSGSGSWSTARRPL